MITSKILDDTSFKTGKVKESLAIIEVGFATLLRRFSVQFAELFTRHSQGLDSSIGILDQQVSLAVGQELHGHLDSLPK